MSNSSSSDSPPPPPQGVATSPTSSTEGDSSSPSPPSSTSISSPSPPTSDSSPSPLSSNSSAPSPPSSTSDSPAPPSKLNTPPPSPPQPISDSSTPPPPPPPSSTPSNTSTLPPSSKSSAPPPPTSESTPPPSEKSTPPNSKTPPTPEPPSPTTDLFPPPPPPHAKSDHSKPKNHHTPPPPISVEEETPPSDSITNSNSGSSNTTSSPNTTGIIVGALFATVIIVLIAILCAMIRRRRRRWDDLPYQSPSSMSVTTDGYRQAAAGFSGPYSGGFGGPNSGGMEGSTGYGYHSGPLTPGSQSSFSYEEMAGVTNGFSRENIIGEGGFGCVYKAILQDGRKVAIKQLKAGSGQGEREFRAEVEIISRVHHRHLVSLVGYCIAEYHRLLVYEFLPNDTLEHHLFGKNIPVLEWSKRVRIAIGSAKGLAYLHEDCHPKIIHRDIKSANILLENSFEPKVADFGLAKLSNDTYTHVSTRVMGTFGYMAPEYASSGKLTDRSDVFSFGVVLLELITGRKPVDTSRPLGDESLVEWARPLLVHALETGNCDELVDPRLDNNYNKNEMFRMIEVAAACVRHSAPKRPRMMQVARTLDTDDVMPDLSNGVKYGQSQAFDSGQYPSDMQRFRLMAFGTNETSNYGDPSGDYDRRSTPNSGEIRNKQQRPPPPKDRQMSGKYAGRQDADTNPIFLGERSNFVGNYG